MPQGGAPLTMKINWRQQLQMDNLWALQRNTWQRWCTPFGSKRPPCESQMRHQSWHGRRTQWILNVRLQCDMVHEISSEAATGAINGFRSRKTGGENDGKIAENADFTRNWMNVGVKLTVCYGNHHSSRSSRGKSSLLINGPSKS